MRVGTLMLRRLWCLLAHRRDHWRSHISSGCYKCGQYRLKDGPPNSITAAFVILWMIAHWEALTWLG
jgi:hypothetical protein